ncbi:MAG: PilX N-terminal domain-containing pilus assembly protein [Gammaproteobacteria bacterium]
MNIPFQRGSVLIVSMLMLLVLTIIGITAMGTSTLEEKMAGNSRDQNLAFQAAEAGLRDAEAYVEGMAAVAAFNGTGGLYNTSTALAPDIYSNATWTGGASIAYRGSAIPGVNTQPRYIVEFVSTTGKTNPELESCYGCATGEGMVTNVRITARGTGGSDNATVILQEYYGKRF